MVNLKSILLKYKYPLAILALVLLSIPLTVVGLKSSRDIRSKAVTTYCSVTTSWPANPNRPSDCQQSLTISYNSPGFAVALAKDGALVAAQADISSTSFTFSNLQANASYHYVVCTPNCGTGKKIKEGDSTSSSSGTLTVSWYYTARLTEAGNLGAAVATKTSTTTSVTFTGLAPDHNYDYYVCTVDCGTGVLVTSGTKRTNPCPITYKVKLTSQGNSSNVIAQTGILPETITSYTFSTSAIAPNTTYDYYVYSPYISTSVYYQASAISDSACSSTSPPPPPRPGSTLPIKDLKMVLADKRTAYFTWTLGPGVDCGGYYEVIYVSPVNFKFENVVKNAIKSDWSVNPCSTTIPKHTIKFDSDLVFGKIYYAVMTEIGSAASFDRQLSNITYAICCQSSK